MSIPQRIERLEKLLRPSDDGSFTNFEREFMADPAHKKLCETAAARHRVRSSLRALMRRDPEVRDVVGQWCVSAIPGALIRVPLSRLIHVPNIPGEKTECRIVVRPERHEDGSEFLQIWLTEPTTVENLAAAQSPPGAIPEIPTGETPDEGQSPTEPS